MKNKDNDCVRHSECFNVFKRIYKITFNEHTNSLQDKVAKKDKNGKTVSCGLHKDSPCDEGYLMVLTNNLAESIREFQEYGGGIKTIVYIGAGFCRVYPEAEENKVDK